MLLMWKETKEMAQLMGISISTLLRMKQQRLLKERRHWIRKNPMAPRSDLLWHEQRVGMALGRI